MSQFERILFFFAMLLWSSLQIQNLEAAIFAKSVLTLTIIFNAIKVKGRIEILVISVLQQLTEQNFISSY